MVIHVFLRTGIAKMNHCIRQIEIAIRTHTIRQIETEKVIHKYRHTEIAKISHIHAVTCFNVLSIKIERVIKGFSTDQDPEGDSQYWIC